MDPSPARDQIVPRFLCKTTAANTAFSIANFLLSRKGCPRTDHTLIRELRRQALGVSWLAPMNDPFEIFTSALIDALTKERDIADADTNSAIDLGVLYSKVKSNMLIQAGGK